MLEKQGKRHDLSDDYPLFKEYGEYGKNPDDGEWYFSVPAPGYGDPEFDDIAIGGLSKHTVIEHEDGTITVSPSILVGRNTEKQEKQWHGFLERGIWRQV